MQRWLVSAITAGLLGTLAGCGSTGHSRSTTASDTGTGSGAVSTAPGVAVAAPGTVTALTTPATLTTVTLPGSGRPAILLGDMNTPEQFIIGALYQDALEAQGYAVTLSRNIGATAVSQAAMAQGSLDIYPEYLNVYDEQVAGQPGRFSTRRAAFSAGQAYAQAHGQELLTPTPFSDTAGIAVLSSYARSHHLRSLADLRRVESELTLGAPLEYMLEADGLTRLERAYDFTPAVTAEITVGSQYAGLQRRTLQATYVQTSDWELSHREFRDLTDPRHVLGFGNVVPVVSQATLKAEGPVFATTINQVDALLTQAVMRGLAAEIWTSTDPAQSAGAVAQEFLQGYGVGAPPPWSTLTSTTSTPTTTTLTTPSPVITRPRITTPASSPPAAVAAAGTGTTTGSTRTSPTSTRSRTGG